MWKAIKAWWKNIGSVDIVNFAPPGYFDRAAKTNHIAPPAPPLPAVNTESTGETVVTMTTDEFARLFKQAMREGKLRA
jgi:hypothetical protein